MNDRLFKQYNLLIGQFKFKHNNNEPIICCDTSILQIELTNQRLCYKNNIFITLILKFFFISLGSQERNTLI